MVAPDGNLRMYTIVANPKDLPGVAFSVREFIICAGGPVVGPVIGTAQTLADARRHIPPAADVRIPGGPNDHPCIVETWL